MLYYLTFTFAAFFSSEMIEEKLNETCEFLLQEVIETPDSVSFFALAMAAPEVMRYRELSNLIEVQALRLMYAELGSEKLDFSVGFFQMKPSFVEELERRLSRDAVLRLKYSELITYEQKPIAAIRQERINRILDPCKSQDYLRAFAELMHFEHQEFLNCANTREQLCFLSTAYNLGFGYETQAILDYQDRQNFPYGSKFQGEQYAFGTLSVRIYDQLNNMLCDLNF